MPTSRTVSRLARRTVVACAAAATVKSSSSAAVSLVSPATELSWASASIATKWASQAGQEVEEGAGVRVAPAVPVGRVEARGGPGAAGREGADRVVVAAAAVVPIGSAFMPTGQPGPLPPTVEAPSDDSGGGWGAGVAEARSGRRGRSGQRDDMGGSASAGVDVVRAHRIVVSREVLAHSLSLVLLYDLGRA